MATIIDSTITGLAQTSNNHKITTAHCPSFIVAEWREVAAKPQAVDWCDMLKVAADVAYFSAGADDAELPIDDLVTRLDPINFDLANELADVAISALDRGLHFGVQLGYALARTWSERPEELENWPARALAYAGLEGRDD